MKVLGSKPDHETSEPSAAAVLKILGSKPDYSQMAEPSAPAVYQRERAPVDLVRKVQVSLLVSV